MCRTVSIRVLLPVLPLLAALTVEGVTRPAIAAPEQVWRGRGRPPRGAPPRSTQPTTRPSEAERQAARRAAVTVTKNPPTVEEREFVNRTKLPPLIRRAVQAHEAVADSEFLIRPEIKQTLVEQEKGLRKVRAKFRVDSVAVTLDMKTTMWLPPQASKSLRDHEDGHRRISERFYEPAEAKARVAAEKLIGTHYPGEGRTVEEAGKAAMEAATQQLVKAYLSETQWASGAVHAAYDKLTRHSTNVAVSEDEAIRQVFEQYEQVKRAEESRTAAGSARRR